MALFWPSLGGPWLRFSDMLNFIVFFSMDFLVFSMFVCDFSVAGSQHGPKLRYMRLKMRYIGLKMRYMRPMLRHTRPMLRHMRAMLRYIWAMLRYMRPV